MAHLNRALEGRYELIREAGQGARAVVFLGRDLKHARDVAVKALLPEFVASVGGQRFRKEIEIVSKLNHPNILPLYDSGEAEGVLYYVMPFAEGETLRDLLASKGTLPIQDSVRLAHQVADALAFAHSRGVLHRDIKPENILLEGGKAVVADFGIASAVQGPESHRLTATGVSVGTPYYMAPEQAVSDGEVSERSDVYALGCVLYEMLVGEPPFAAPTVPTLLAKKLRTPPPSPLQARKEVPSWLNKLVLGMLETAPGDRVASAEEVLGVFQQRLQLGVGPPADLLTRWSERLFRRRVPLLAGAAVIGVVGFVLDYGGWIPGPAGTESVAVDTTLYAVFPFRKPSNLDVPFEAARSLDAALASWEGITVLDPVGVLGSEGLATAGSMTSEEAAEFVRSAGAGRLVRGAVRETEAGLHVTAEVHTTSSPPEMLGSYSSTFPSESAPPDSLFADLAERVLLRDALQPGDGQGTGTFHLGSRRAFLRGRRSLESWDLETADAAFTEAARLDRDHAEAHLWVALSRAWAGQARAEWEGPAARVGLGIGMSHRDSLMAKAILAEAQGDHGMACPLWVQLTSEEPDDFAVWFGSAKCALDDEMVLADPGSPSGWSFRTSRNSALGAFERASQLLPNVLSSYAHGSFAPLRYIFLTSTKSRRFGVGENAENGRFLAVPAWRGDSLSLVPYPVGTVEDRLTVSPQGFEEAVYHQRRKFRDVVRGWVSSSPSDPLAAEAYAIAQSILGDSEALNTVADARALAGNESEFRRSTGVEALLTLAFALPDDSAGVGRGKALADSALISVGADGAPDPLLFAGLAALTGQASRAARLMKITGVAERIGGQGSYRETGPSLMVYAALGGPTDSLDALESRLRTDIEGSTIGVQRRMARLQWLARAATLAFGKHRMESIDALEGEGDPFLDLQAAWAGGDTARVLKGMEDTQTARIGFLPSSVSLDALLPEAELLMELGKHAEARAWLAPAMDLLPQIMPEILTNPVEVAALVRMVALRSEIAFRLGDLDEASRWREVVGVLWEDADEFLRAEVRRLDSMF